VSRSVSEQIQTSQLILNASCLAKLLRVADPRSISVSDVAPELNLKNLFSIGFFKM